MGAPLSLSLREVSGRIGCPLHTRHFTTRHLYPMNPSSTASFRRMFGSRVQTLYRTKTGNRVGRMHAGIGPYCYGGRTEKRPFASPVCDG
jgi:hypothetical protein